MSWRIGPTLGELNKKQPGDMAVSQGFRGGGAGVLQAGRLRVRSSIMSLT